MKNHSLAAELKKAGLLDNLRAVIAVMPALESLIEALTDYMTTAPQVDHSKKVSESLLVACIRDGIDAVMTSGGRIEGQAKGERLFILALFKQTPRLLDMSICCVDEEDETHVCWEPFCDSISSFLDRLPAAQFNAEPCPMRKMIPDALARELLAARVLPVVWAACFAEAAGLKEAAVA